MGVTYASGPPSPSPQSSHLDCRFNLLPLNAFTGSNLAELERPHLPLHLTVSVCDLEIRNMETPRLMPDPEKMFSDQKFPCQYIP